MVKKVFMIEIRRFIHIQSWIEICEIIYFLYIWYIIGSNQFCIVLHKCKVTKDYKDSRKRSILRRIAGYYKDSTRRMILEDKS